MKARRNATGAAERAAQDARPTHFNLDNKFLQYYDVFVQTNIMGAIGSPVRVCVCVCV